MRTQIALDDEQHTHVKRKSAGLGISMAEYVRRLVDADLEGVAPQLSPSAIIGIGRSGGSDIESEGTKSVDRAVDWHTNEGRAESVQ